MNPKQIVADGYDKVSYQYRGDNGDAPNDYGGWLVELSSLLPKQSPVLDLGCGCGLPVSKVLAESFHVTGVDISPVQIERAKLLVPTARFIQADMSAVNFDAGSFMAVVSFFAIIHLPLDEQPALISRLTQWIRPGGYFLATLGHGQWTGTENDWLDVPGATMYWSHTDAETYRTWLTQTGFTLLWNRFVPEGKGGHLLILARLGNSNVP